MSQRQAFNAIDRLVRMMRIRSLKARIPDGSKVLDVGCGQENWLVRSVGSRWHPESVGIDPALRDEFVGVNGRRVTVHDVVTESAEQFDIVTSLAVIEHLPIDEVPQHLTAIHQALKPGGSLLLTTPTPRSKPVLEFLAYRLKVISAYEIRDHQHYYTGAELTVLMNDTGFNGIDHQTFQAGLNQRVIARKR